ncbi:uncharacterized protein FIESC28_02098 [Fusarium coffeatum]|uniref:Uncharacterized protein n=1 Tax=Fusarium coffeatum TaxID=231269 RepID=A0A366S911_9HYPO|nr:uncharacterized protein FIESC28_02098 [Fusarium coffeatum]RBR25190.1 hypothetical protein FIESC28_02098 [Fusarium coffeatum]
MQPNHDPVERHGHDASMTRETVEEMIAAALSRAALNPRTAVLNENDQGHFDQYQKKIAVLEHQRDEALEKVKALENERDGPLSKIAVLEKERDEALSKITGLEKERDEVLSQVEDAEIDAQQAWDYANMRINRKQKRFDNILAIKEAKIARLESQLANLHSLSNSDATVASTTARPEDRTELASQEDTFPSSETSSVFSF